MIKFEKKTGLENFISLWSKSFVWVIGSVVDGSLVNCYKSIPCRRMIQIISTCVCSIGNEYWIGARYDTSDWMWENGIDVTETFPTVRDTSLYWLIHTARERDQEQWILICCTEMSTLIQDKERNRDPLFPVVFVQFPVCAPVSLICSVNKPYGCRFVLPPSIVSECIQINEERG